MRRSSFAVLAAILLTNLALAGPPRVAQSTRAAEGSSSAAGPASSAAGKQFIEIRTYQLVDSAAEKVLDEYLADALIPALQRQGLGPIGVLDQLQPADSIEVKLVISGPSLDALLLTESKLTADDDYQVAAASYLDTAGKSPLLKRIHSELLLAFDCWPKTTVPTQKKAGKDRLFELRVYESATEKLAALKVEMFNVGEVPIFLDAGIMPVFMGQALIGEMQPNLTYMVCYDDQAAMKAAWPKFLAHPDWKKLKNVAKYKGTVSKIHKSLWTPKPYSQL